METRPATRERTFSVMVDGETVQERLDPRGGPVRLNAWAGCIEIRDAASGELVATLPMMDLDDLDEGPWTTPVDLPSGDRMILTVSAKPSAEEDALPELSLVVHHEAVQEAERAGARPAGVPPRPFRSRLRVPLALAGTVLLLLGVFGAGSAVKQQRFTKLLGRYTALVRELGLDEPFSVRFSAVGQRRLQLDIGVSSEIVGEVSVDWGDPTSPDPVGGTRVFPQAGVQAIEPPLRLSPVVHDYPPVGPEGLRTVVRVRVKPIKLPRVRPETLSEARLNPSKRLWVLPYGIVLDPPPAMLRIVVPKPDDVVPPLTEVRLEMDSITADVHFLGVDEVDPRIYYHLGSLPAPRPGERAATRVIDTARLGQAGPFRLVVVSTSQIEAPEGAALPWHEIPPAAPFDEIEVRHAGVILAPTPGSVVSATGVDTVRAKVLLPGRYAVVAVRPEKEGRYWVENDALATSEFVEFAVQASYGGRDSYEIWLGITEDPHLFKAGDRLEDLGRVDPQGRPIYWVGPVEVSHP